MRWNTLSNDVPKVMALADVLLGAAAADGHFAAEEGVAVTGTLMKVLGVVTLPEAVQEHIRAFRPAALDLAAACASLGLADDHDKRDLIKVVAKVVHADDDVHATESLYLQALGDALGVKRDSVADLIGSAW